MSARIACSIAVRTVSAKDVRRRSTRRVGILGHGAPRPGVAVQQARNLPMDLADAGTRAKFMLHDRDASFSTALNKVSRRGHRIVRSAIQGPRMNPVMERWIGSCRRELPAGPWSGTSGPL